MLKYSLLIFSFLFSVVIVITYLTDPDPVDPTPPIEVNNEYDSNWKSSIELIYENTSTDTKAS